MTGLPQFVSLGEALTDMIRLDPERWLAVPGGAGWNVARVMATFGVASAFAGAVSEDCFGDTLWQASEAARLDLRFMQRYAKSPLLAIVHQTQPPRYFFVGDDSADLHFAPQRLPEGWMSAVRWAHFGGISLTRAPLAQHLVALAETLKARGVQISYDPNFRVAMTAAYDATFERMVRLADFIKVSEEDLVGLLRTPDVDAALAAVRAMNPQAACLCTLGGKGAQLFVGAHSWCAAPPAIEVVDTVGAGDCCLAGMLVSLISTPRQGWSAHLRHAVAAGAAACTAAGACPPTLAAVAALATQVEVRTSDSARLAL